MTKSVVYIAKGSLCALGPRPCLGISFGIKSQSSGPIVTVGLRVHKVV